MMSDSLPHPPARSDDHPGGMGYTEQKPPEPDCTVVGGMTPQEERWQNAYFVLLFLIPIIWLILVVLAEIL